MRKAAVYRNQIFAGVLEELSADNYVFTYDESYFKDPSKPPISLTFPKGRQRYESGHLFPFFYNMLAEGVNKKLQCRQLQIDEADSFGLLLATAGTDTVGAVTVKPIE